jgi:hypothetical protein
VLANKLVDDRQSQDYHLGVGDTADVAPIARSGPELIIMPIRRLDKRLTRALRGGLLFAGAVAFVVAALGVPLPSGTRKDRSVAFPCMDRSCGCHDAADCKKHCCCFSSAEKLAWAAEHDVDPTPFVDDRALVALVVTACHAHETANCDARAPDSCCAKKHSQRQDAGGETDNLLSIAAYRHCSGLVPLWTLLSAALPPQDPINAGFKLLFTGQIGERDCLFNVTSFSPPTPPPRA